MLWTVIMIFFGDAAWGLTVLEPSNVAGRIHAPILAVNSHAVFEAMQGRWGGEYRILSPSDGQGCYVPSGVDWNDTIVLMPYYRGCSMDQKSRVWVSSGAIALIATTTDINPADLVAFYWDKTKVATIPILLMSNELDYFSSSRPIALDLMNLLSANSNVSVQGVLIILTRVSFSGPCVLLGVAILLCFLVSCRGVSF